MNGGLRKVSVYLLAGVSTLGLLVAGGTTAKAASVEQLEASMRSMQAQMAELEREVQQAKAAAAAAKGSSGGPLDFNLKWKGAPELSSSNGEFTFKVRGRLQTDYEHVDQDSRVTTYPDVGAAELRRARLGVEGVMFYNWKYVVEVDFAGEQTRIRDAWMQYQGFKINGTPLIARIGNYKTPNTFEDLTSDNYVDTIERATLINAWGIDPETPGAMLAYWSPYWGLAAGIFSQPLDYGSPLVNGFTGNENVTFAARGTIAPINRKVDGGQQVVMFGASVRTRDTGNDQQYLSYNAKGDDFHLTNNVLATGNIGDSDTFWGLEAAGLWGPFALQGEYGHTDVNLPGGAFIRTSNPKIPTVNPFIGVPDPSFDGWYIEGSWFFGGHKTYDNSGDWGRPVVDHPMVPGSGSWGALQIVGKYDVLDQSTGNAPVSGSYVGACHATSLFPSANQQDLALCGDMATWTVGVNWYPNDHIRFMLDYAESDLSNYPTTPVPPNTGAIGPKAGFDGGTIRGVAIRAQIDW